MRTHFIASCLPVLAAIFLPLAAAHALDDAGAKAVIARFIGSQKIEGMEASAGEHTIADLNSDSRPDIVLIWHALGPTFGYSKMSVFLDQGKNYRTLTADLPGQIENVTVKGSTIVLNTLTLGPKDPRCCPTVKTRVTYQWTGNKLVKLK